MLAVSLASCASEQSPAASRSAQAAELGPPVPQASLESGRIGFGAVPRNYAGTDEAWEEMLDVAERLGVQYVLMGNVRGSANRMRVSVDLVDAAAGRQVWSERFERPTEDICAVQDEISIGVATELVVQ